MTYQQISKAIGSYSLQAPTGEGNISQDLTPYVKNTSGAKVEYITSREAQSHSDQNGYDEEFVKKENPAVEFIRAYVVKHDSNTSSAKNEQNESNDDYSSYLGWWKNNHGDVAGASVEFISIDSNTATFKIQCVSKNAARVAETDEITAKVRDDEIEFDYHDSFDNHGSGKISLNGDTIYVTAKPENVRGGYAVYCDTEMTKK